MKKYTLSIGIPVHNEEANIAYLLRTIFRQQKKNFTLERVFVVCDGTTDNTESIARNIAKKYPQLVVLNDRKHKGKMGRLMEMYKLNKSNFLAIFDGDVVLGSAHVLEHMVQKFTDSNIVVVGANNQPLPTEKFVGKLVNTWSNIWYHARKAYNNADNIHNIRGCCMMLRNDFAKTIKFPKGLISDAQYIYFCAKFSGKKFVFAEDSVVYYMKPTTIKDYLLQSKRTVSEVEKLAAIFGTSVPSLYKIPKMYSVRAFIYKLVSDPIFTLSAIVFTYAMKQYPTHMNTINGATWKRVDSTKKAITMITF